MRSEPSLIEFEMAYQSHVDSDRIRFAIKQTEQFGGFADKKYQARAIPRPVTPNRRAESSTV